SVLGWERWPNRCGVAAIARVLDAVLFSRNAFTALSLDRSVGLLGTSAGSRSVSHRHQRCLLFINSRLPRNGRTYFAATGSSITSVYSAGSTIKLPPSRGMFPKRAGVTTGDSGVERFATSTLGPSTR